MYKYLIISDCKTVFLDNYYDFENNYVPGMIVINLIAWKITFDGINWLNIEENHL
jgi:hypothetical protein